jgi:hypothetical protein
VLAERLRSQLLAGPPAPSAVAATRRLLAVQAQDPRGVRLAIRARTTAQSVAELEHSLTVERSLLITWLSRGTLHLVSAEDYPWLHALTTPPLHAANARRLAQEGVSPAAAERGARTIESALAQGGPLTRGQLKAKLDGAGVPTQGQALVHLLMQSTLRALTVRGPMVGKEQAYVLVRDWLSPSPPVERDRALAELARRYLAGHAPADDRDLARWAGLPLRDARAGLAAIAPELAQRDHGLVSLRAAPRAPAPLPPPRLLGPYEPVLLGWTSREFLAGAHQAVVAVNGLFRPFALVDGRVVALWRLRRGEVEIEPLEKLTAPGRAALEEDGRQVLSFLGLR